VKSPKPRGVGTGFMHRRILGVAPIGGEEFRSTRDRYIRGLTFTPHTHRPKEHSQKE